MEPDKLKKANGWTSVSVETETKRELENIAGDYANEIGVPVNPNAMLKLLMRKWRELSEER